MTTVFSFWLLYFLNFEKKMLVMTLIRRYSVFEADDVPAQGRSFSSSPAVAVVELFQLVS